MCDCESKQTMLSSHTFECRGFYILFEYNPFISGNLSSGLKLISILLSLAVWRNMSRQRDWRKQTREEYVCHYRDFVISATSLHWIKNNILRFAATWLQKRSHNLDYLVLIATHGKWNLLKKSKLMYGEMRGLNTAWLEKQLWLNRIDVSSSSGKKQLLLYMVVKKTESFPKAEIWLADY